jgi:predicted protein tyrosine phosphatase
MRRMLRYRALAAAVCLGLAAAATPGRAQTPPPTPDAATVHVLPGDVPLIRDEPDTTSVPRHFRMMSDPFPGDAHGPLPSRAGLDALRASGSAQFGAQGLRAIIERVGRPVVVVDLRQESHGFLDGVPVSWYAFHDQVNIVRTLIEIRQDEQRRLAALAGETDVTVLVKSAQTASGEISEATPVHLTALTPLTERELVQSQGAGYFRIPATDFLPPTAANVDRFVAFASSLPPEVWLHIHCHAGDGRTTTFLAIWDMMHNAARVSVEDIVRRQALLGPHDLFAVGTPENWKYPFQLEMAGFIRRFHQYAKENAADGFTVPWSVWSAAHPPAP